MNYTLRVRAFIQIKRKDKAETHAKKLFPNLPFKNMGRYWKDESQWEYKILHECEYDDDKTALWETLTYFCKIISNWSVNVSHDDTSELVVNGVGENKNNTGLTWCSFQLTRSL